MRLAVAMETSKNDGRTIDILKFPQRMNEQPLKVSASRSKSSFQNFEKTLLRDNNNNKHLFVRRKFNFAVFKCALQ